jgi:hypothetical protein
MWIKVSYMAFIDNAELAEAGVSLFDDDAIVDYMFEQGGEEEFHDHGLGAEIVDRSNRC